MSTADPTIYDRQKRYREAQAERGLKLVKVWVPEGAVTTIKAVATELREGHKRG
jgi:DNA-binding LacI/PurR family transcriptional regulator